MASCERELDLHYLPLQKKYRTSSLLSLNKKYRSHFEIVALMLEAMKGNGATRFSVMKHTSINSAQLKKYLRCLSEIEFIEMDSRGSQVFYRASDKGLAFLRQYYVLLGMLFGASSRNKSIGIVLETEYDVSRRKQPSATQIVVRPQHAH